MVKNIVLNLYEDNKLKKSYPIIQAISSDNTLIFILDGIKSSLDNTKFIRENKEFLFTLDILNNSCTYLLKENNLLFDILVEKIKYKEKNNCIILEYKIASIDEKITIEIIKKGEIYE